MQSFGGGVNVPPSKYIDFDLIKDGLAKMARQKEAPSSDFDEKAGVHPVDVHVGHKLRARRILMGMSQTALGKLVGITFQQIQKYERATNRVSVSRLHDFCKALNVEFDYFIDGYTSSKATQKGMADSDGQAGFDGEEDVMTKRETLKLIRAYYSIKDEKLRHQLLSMARTMADMDE